VLDLAVMYIILITEHNLDVSSENVPFLFQILNKAVAYRQRITNLLNAKHNENVSCRPTCGAVNSHRRTDGDI